jgi:DNA uptake protein ComE-like DNA-binding protein
MTAPLIAMASIALALAGWVTVGALREDPAEASRDVLPVARIDINVADAATLEVLPSIGPALSRRIVEDREANGLYRSARDLLRVKGINAEVLRRIEPFIAPFDQPPGGRPEGGGT